MIYRAKVSLRGPGIEWEYRSCHVVKGLHLGFSAKMVQWFALNGASVGIGWTSRWVERAR